MRAPRLTLDQLAELKRLVKEGCWYDSEIAKQLGTTRKRVAYYRKRLGYLRGPRRLDNRPELVTGASYQEAAANRKGKEAVDYEPPNEAEPTEARPGTLEKIAVLRERFATGRPLHCHGDAGLDDEEN